MSEIALTVSEFVEAVDTLLGSLEEFVVEGEVSGFKVKDGKWVLFELKDEMSVVRCFMTAWQLNVQLEDGMKVVARGRGALKNWGQFSFNLREVTPSGEGALRRAFLLLKKKLAGEGLFDGERKRALPRFPGHIALITSRDAAAYDDFLKVVAARQGGLTISFVHTQVQGEPAPDQIVQALETANTELPDVEALVLVRGGGSLEDLQAFNDERVVRAVAGSRHPIIVGVGHERDESLAELAADVRASTPSNAAELLVRDRRELMGEVSRLREQLSSMVHGRMDAQRETMHKVLLILRGEVKQMKQSLGQLQRVLQSYSPKEVLRRGYSLTRGVDGKVVTRAGGLSAGDRLVTQFKEGAANSEVTSLQLEDE